MTKKRPTRLAPPAAERPSRPPGTSVPADRERAGVLPGPREIIDPLGPFLVPLLLLVLTRIFAWFALPVASEDAYITFRYARHLANGYGLVYNPGQHVFGFSSPPWTLWAALGCALAQDPVFWTRATTLLADALTLLLVGHMIEREADGPGGRARAAAWCFTFFFAVWPYFAAVAVSGMESSAMLMLIALTAVMARRGSMAAGPLLGLLALWRPEGVACAAVIALGARPRDRVVGLAVFAAGVATLAMYFGWPPIPQSVIAKSSVYGTPGPWAGRYRWGRALPLRSRGMLASGEAGHLSALSVLLGPAAVAGGIALWRRRASALALAVGACLVVWLGYALLGVAYFYWYLLLPLAGVAVLAAVGLPRLVRGGLLYASIALLVATMWVDAHNLYVGRAQNEFYGFGAVSTWLRDHVRPGDKVMLEPIGIVGWRNPVVIVDEVGLVSPSVAKRRLQGPGWYTDVAGAERPDWIVIRRAVLTGTAAFAGVGTPFRSRAERDTLFSRYAQTTVVDEQAAGENALVILQRVR
jgi:arabinofuranosyltransferase